MFAATQTLQFKNKLRCNYSILGLDVDVTVASFKKKIHLLVENFMRKNKTPNLEGKVCGK